MQLASENTARLEVGGVRAGRKTVHHNEQRPTDRAGATEVHQTVYQTKKFEELEKSLECLRDAFSRRQTFEWMRAFVLGSICRTDDLGIAAVVRGLELDAASYECLLHLFRSDAWTADSLRENWWAYLAGNVPFKRVAGRVVLPSDGCKVNKEGLRMAAATKLHQSSETSSKGEYIRGVMYGAVGVVAEGEDGRTMCVPMMVNIQDGLRAAAGWDGAGDAGISPRSHVAQSVECAFRAARALKLQAILAMDRYFMTVVALKELNRLNAEAEADGFGPCLVQLITKAKTNAAFWTDPPEREPHTSGRPRLKGDDVKYDELVEADTYEELVAKGFHDVEVEIGGGKRTILAASRELRWGKGVYQPVLVVAVKCVGKHDQVLVSTDRSLTVEQVIEAYAARWSIECSFRSMKQDTNTFGWRFWSSSTPEHNWYAKKGDPNRLDSVTDDHGRELVLESVKAAEKYVAASCVVLGLLQLMALAEPGDGEVAWSSFSRTPRGGAVSVRAMRDFLRKRVFGFIHGDTDSTLASFIRSHLVGEGGYSPKAREKRRENGR